jgi:uncharacterized membrane protein
MLIVCLSSILGSKATAATVRRLPMPSAHLVNLCIHIGAGTLALGLGLALLARQKGTVGHVALGRLFCYGTLVVSLSAVAGLVLFRFLPLFSVITVLVLYQLGSGWHAARTQERGPTGLDALWTVAALTTSLAIAPQILRSSPDASLAVVHSTFGALATVVVYDTVRWMFPRHWHRVLWRYEHSYKLIAATFGMLSALVGNVVRVGHPWSQLLPSALGLTVAAYFFLQLYREDTRRDAADTITYGDEH